MAILWCGGEDVDVNCSMGGYYDASFSRSGLYITEKVDTPLIAPVTNIWLSVVGRLSQDAVDGGLGFIGLTNALNSGIALRTVEGGGVTHLDIIKTDGSLLSAGTISIYGSSSIKHDLQIINYGTNGTVNHYMNSAINATYTGDLSPSIGNIDIVKGCFWRCSRVGWGYMYTSISEIIMSDEDTRLFRLKTIAPSATGDISNWTGAYTDVDEITLSDTDTLVSTTADSEFLCNVTDLPSTNLSIKAVKLVARAAYVTNPASLQLVIKTNGTVSTGPSNVLAAAWKSKELLLQNNPVTGMPFTAGEINSLQIGVKNKDV